jgi:hypothetical protein
VEFGILAIGDGLPSSGEDLLDGIGSVEFVGFTVAEAVDASAESFCGTNGVSGMGGSGVDVDGLGEGKRSDGTEGNKQEWKEEVMREEVFHGRILGQGGLALAVVVI